MRNQFSFAIRITSKFLMMMLGVVAMLQECKASHGMGGEITWTCLPGGQYVFELKFYRDCNGIPGPGSITLQTTVPGVPTISLALFAQNDISPNGYLNDGVTNCSNCSQGNGSNPIPGIVEEYIYHSPPVNLPGAPPVNGWVFTVSDCCRSNNLTNITGAGGIGFQFRTIMYPFTGNSTLPCFDSSPYFAEKPATIFCTGTEVRFSAAVVDPEQDSLVYSWGNPFSDSGIAIPFAPGYSVNSQLPSPVQNPANVAALLNPNTGEIIFVSFTGGYFVTNIKVTAYKCGIKVAEIFREINVVLNSNCSPVYGGALNTPPNISAPFIDPGTGLQTSYTDTVNFGDTVSFSLYLTDYNLFTNFNTQNITVSGSGLQFGLNFTDPDTGCGLPPCATISNGLPVSFSSAGQIDFNWVTSCDHVSGLNSLCGGSSTYSFTIHAHDNYCPANASTLATISITVIGSQSTAITSTGPSAICAGDTVVLTASGAQTYSWNTGQTGDSIYVTQPGFYSVIDSVSGSCYSLSSVFIPTGFLNVTASAVEDTICINWPPVQLSGSPPGGSWTGYGIFGGQFNPAFTGAGVYDLIYHVSDSIGCTGSDTIQMTVNLCTGLNETFDDAGVFVYPNPAIGEVTLVITNATTTFSTIELYNVYGQKVMDVFEGKIEHPEWRQTFDVSALPKGIYVFRVNGVGLQRSVFVK